MSKAVFSYYAVKFYVSHAARLLEAIQRLQQLADAVGPILKALRLSYIDLFL